MMRLSQFALLLLAVGGAQAFAPSPTFVSRTRTAALSMTAETHISKDFAAGSGMNEHDIPILIKNLSKENFEESLEMLEPLLTVECVGDICDDYISQLKDKASEIGMEIPAGYASTHH